MDIYAIKDKAIMKQLGARLKEERIAQNISQVQLAEASGLSQFSVSRIENGYNTSILSILGVLRVLHRLELLNDLYPKKKRGRKPASAEPVKERKRSYHKNPSPAPRKPRKPKTSE